MGKGPCRKQIDTVSAGTFDDEMGKPFFGLCQRIFKKTMWQFWASSSQVKSLKSLDSKAEGSCEFADAMVASIETGKTWEELQSKLGFVD